MADDTATGPAAATEATTVEKLTSEPPASNPGADDKTGGMASDAGGLSGAAHKEIPNPNAATPTSEKRKSIFGTFKGMFGMDKRSQSSTASDGTYVGAATAAVTGTAAAVAETVQHYTTGTTEGTTASEETKPAATKSEGLDYSPAAADTTVTTVTDTTAAGTATETKDAAMAEESKESKDVAAAKDEETTEPTAEGAEGGDHKPPQPAHNTNMTNPDAIPTAGGKKVGEDHIGESKVVAEDPAKPTPAEQREGAVVASADGQPTKEVADNTAKNTGAATSGPTTSTEPKEKKKFMTKLKEKLPIGKNKNKE